MSTKRKQQDVVTELLAKSGGLRARINAHCVSCIYDSLEPGTWRQQVAACSVTSCSLWEARPQSKSKAVIPETTGAAYTKDQTNNKRPPYTSVCLQTAEEIAN